MVLIDEEAIAAYGQWPWPRTRLAELVTRISDLGAAAIGMDLFFPEPDRFSPAAIAAELPLLPSNLATALQALPSNDERLAEAMRGRRVVLGISAEEEGFPRFDAPPRAAPIVTSSDGLPRLARFDGSIGNIEVLDAAAASRGLMNTSAQERIVRTAPLVARVHGALVPGLGLETLRVGMDAGMRVATQGQGLLELRFGEVRTRLQDDGTHWLRFNERAGTPTVGAAAVLRGEADAERFARKVVLVGVSGLGLLDYKATPLGEVVPGVKIHAQVVENLFDGTGLVRPSWAAWAEAGVFFMAAVLLAFVVPRMSAVRAIALLAGLVAVIVGGALAAFLGAGVLLDAAWPTIGTTAVFGGVLAGSLSEAQRQRRQLREQAARMAGEVEAARRIQMGLVPDPTRTVGHDARVKVAATLRPARSVGGDFYDCFLVDERHLFFAVADVSGKGLPAAMFMASVKSQLRSAALRAEGMGQVLARVHDEIVLVNPEQLFVTAIAARLDLETGNLDYANAGHEPPFVQSSDGARRLDGRGGPPLGVLDAFRYPTEQVTLAPGQWLCLVSDGATEAMNPAREFFGNHRLAALLKRFPSGADPEDIVRRVDDAVRTFAAGADAADDLTLLALRWDGPSGR